MINSSEKCCSPFTCSSLSTVEGGGVLPGEGRGKERGGGVRDGGRERGKGRFKSQNLITIFIVQRFFAPSYDKHV